MFAFVTAGAVVFLLLVISEFMWRSGNVDPEYTRKFVHVSVGSFVAFWPFFLDRTEIVGLSLAFIAVVAAAHYLDVFKAMRSVQRPTWGEIFFALSVGFVAVVAHSNWIYTIALLHMSLADGLAAMVGIKYGKSTRYFVFRHAKSAVGTATFLAISLAILTCYSLATPHSFSLLFIPLAVVVTVLENLAIRGLDNLLVPLLVAVGLNLIG